MAARNRPRNGVAKDDGSDAHEESNIWNSIVLGLQKLQTIQAKAAEVAKQQVEAESRIQSCELVILLFGINSTFQCFLCFMPVSAVCL